MIIILTPSPAILGLFGYHTILLHRDIFSLCSDPRFPRALALSVSSQHSVSSPSVSVGQLVLQVPVSQLSAVLLSALHRVLPSVVVVVHGEEEKAGSEQHSATHVEHVAVVTEHVHQSTCRQTATTGLEE